MSEKAVRKHKVFLLVLALIWVVMVSLVNPAGNFPLNDDWAYGRPVKSLIEEGRLQFTGWTSMTLIAQVLWGFLFCLPFGFSFTALRLSTLVLGLAGILATYGLLREAEASPQTALLGALLVAVNPLFCELSFTFMTDVPFFAFGIISLYFLVRGLQKEKSSHLLIGFLFMAIATLVRQLGVIIPLSFGIAYVVKHGLRRKTIIPAMAPTLLTIGILFGYEFFLRSTIGVPLLYHLKSRNLLDLLLSKKTLDLLIIFSKQSIVASLYLGLFLLPLLMAVKPKALNPNSNKCRLTVLITLSTLLSLALLLVIWKHQHILGNVLIDFGLGPVTLRDIYILKLDHLPKAPGYLWLLLAVGGIAGIIALVNYVYPILAKIFQETRASHLKHRDWLMIFMVSGSVLYFLPLGIAGYYHRYLIFLLPLMMVFIVRLTRGNRSPGNSLTVFSAFTLIIVYGLFSVGSTHDYLSWNRARWKALSYLVEDAHISPAQIDGGFEFNGFYLYDDDYQAVEDKSWWWVHNDEFIISFGPIDGYRQLKQYSFRRWIPFGRGRIFILGKMNS